MAHLLSRVLPTLAKAAVTLLLLGLLLRKTGYAAILQHLRDITPVTAFIGLSVLYAGLVFATARWQIVLRSIGLSFTGSSLFRLTLIGQFFNQALPSAIGGDGMRVWLLYRRGCSLGKAFNSVLIDRIAGFIVLAIMSLYGLPTLAQLMLKIPKFQTVVGIVVVSIGVFVLFYVLARARARLSGFRAGRLVAQVITDVLFLAAKPGESTKLAILSIASQIANFILIWLILTDLGSDVSFVGVLVVAPVVLLLLVLPISIAGWGLREGLFVVGFSLLSVPKDVALATSIIYGLMNLVTGLVGGPLWMIEPPRSHRPVANSHPIAEPDSSTPSQA